MSGAAYFIWLLFQIVTFAIFFRVILSWFSLRPDNPILIILYEITEPILSPIRRVVPRIGMFDITPMVAILLLSVIRLLLYAFA